MLNRKNMTVALLAACLLALSPAALRAGLPTDQVRQTADRVLSVLQDSRLKSPDKQQERRAQIRQIDKKCYRAKINSQTSKCKNLRFTMVKREVAKRTLKALQLDAFATPGLLLAQGLRNPG